MCFHSVCRGASIKHTVVALLCVYPPAKLLWWESTPTATAGPVAFHVGHSRFRCLSNASSGGAIAWATCFHSALRSKHARLLRTSPLERAPFGQLIADAFRAGHARSCSIELVRQAAALATRLDGEVCCDVTPLQRTQLGWLTRGMLSPAATRFWSPSPAFECQLRKRNHISHALLYCAPRSKHKARD